MVVGGRLGKATCTDGFYGLNFPASAWAGSQATQATCIEMPPLKDVLKLLHQHDDSHLRGAGDMSSEPPVYNSGLWSRRRFATFFDERSPWQQLESPGASLMRIDEVHLPSKFALHDVGRACKLSLNSEVPGDSIGGNPSTLPAKVLGPNLSKAAECSARSSRVVLRQVFGQLLHPAPTSGIGSLVVGGGYTARSDPGVRLINNNDVPIGTRVHRDFVAAQDACRDFGKLLLHKLGKNEAAARVVEPRPVLTTSDASHTLRAFGRCLEGMGELTAIQACKLGQLQLAGGTTAAACKEVQGHEDDTPGLCTVQ